MEALATCWFESSSPREKRAFLSVIIPVLYFEGVVLDELAAGLDDVAHEHGKDEIGHNLIFSLHLQPRALFGVA